MKKSTTKFMSLAGVLTLGLGLAACSSDDGAYPPKQIEVIVPWAAGGGSDQATRQLLIASEKECKTRFVVANRTGAAGATGHEAIAKAKTDGENLGTLTAEVSILPNTGGLNKTIEDFAPVMRFAAISPAFVVKADSPLKSIDDLVAALEADEQVRVGTTGKGGVWDIAAGGFEEAIGSSFTTRVPYDGGGAIIQAILGGHIEVAVLAAPEAVEQVKAGELRVLAVASEERASVLPDAPTLKESNIDWATETWFGIGGPKGLAEDKVSYLHDCLKLGYETDGYQEFLANMGFNPGYQNTTDFTAFIKEQNDAFAELIPSIY